MSHTAYIAVGTNLGDRVGNYRTAIEKIGELADTRVSRVSSMYESEPHGRARNWFLNGAIEVVTEQDSVDLLKDLKNIEKAMGRKPTPKGKGKNANVSRIIDLDILLFDLEIIDTRALKVPHLELANRKFVLLPLAELAPSTVHPVLGASISILLAQTPDEGRVRMFREPN
ncbi:MAG: 2-amino-4-hydroxy-6-hydroxymethyldihydropteridine diphosphokinase [Hyphomicrobiaceae bacterium]|jgi:2-amino-4-hydroxy-6-hydroxymethyldihydropteridine diphosphokinase